MPPLPYGSGGPKLIRTNLVSNLVPRYIPDQKNSDPTTCTPTVSLGRVQDGIALMLNVGEPNVDYLVLACSENNIKEPSLV
jgi:hypothetical protein